MAMLESNFAKTAIAMDPGRLTFLDLPAELRFTVYAYFTPKDQDTFHFGKPAYDGLLRTRKQIRNEAQREIQRAANKYYRSYEAKWLLEEGFRIKVEPIIDPGKVTVVLSQDLFMSDTCEIGKQWLKYRFHVPLASLKLKRLAFKISPNTNTLAPNNLGCVSDRWAVTQLLMSIFESNPQAQRIYFHWGTLMPGQSKGVFENMCLLSERQWMLNRNQKEKDAQYKWLLTTNADYSSDTACGIWVDRVPEYFH
ncbi:hypothetical protein G6011_03534 [Alternaria panax]|uniref:Uncharacterized protein n=1 Tax=Alternaria panax TaxID=48097 RepID=A0AAD4IFE1_9PLEO|nr:hypothetical protein G6011_03534 [Alternaria panax]